MHLFKYMIVLIILIFFSINSFAADCSINLESHSITINWDSNFAYETVRFNVNKTGNDSCDIRLGFTKGGSNSYSRSLSNEINYNLYKTNSFSVPLKDNSDVLSLDETINLSFDSGSHTQNVTYYFYINSSTLTSPTLKRAGLYTDSFHIKAYDSSDFPNTNLHDTTISVNFTIPESLQIRVGDLNDTISTGATSANVDLLNINESAQEQQKSIIVYSNVGYKIKASSLNSNKLIHSSLTNKVINYNFSINNAIKSLNTSPSVILQNTDTTSANGDNYIIKLNTNKEETASAGTYSDTITITIEEDSI